MRVVHVLLLSMLVAACNRPAPTGTANEAKPATEPPAAANAESTVQESGLVALTPEQIRTPVSSATCNLEQIGGVVVPDPQPIAVGSRTFSVAGWIFDDVAKAPVSDLHVRVTAKQGGSAWQQKVVSRLDRADVQAAYGGDAALLNTGFTATLDASALPAGDYAVALFYQRDGQDVACDNGRGVVLK